jgi:hypothetical protein
MPRHVVPLVPSLVKDTQSAIVRQTSEPDLSRPNRFPALFVAAGALALALLLSGCGRRGSLDPPPGGYQLDPGTTRVPTSRRGAVREQPQKQQEYDVDGRPIPPDGPKRTFPLDPLIR